MLTLDPPSELVVLERQAARLAAICASLSALRVARPVLSSAEWKGAAATSHETRAARLDRLLGQADAAAQTALTGTRAALAELRG